MSQMIAGAIAIGVLAISFYLGFRRFKPELSESEALRIAVGIAWKFWNSYSYKMPRLLLNPGAADFDDLIEAGRVLRDLVVSEVSDRSLPREITMVHPELARVDPYKLAMGVAAKADRQKYQEVSRELSQ